MNQKEILSLVEQMRKAQIEYYQDRSSRALMRAKALERRVDLLIEQNKSGKLFDK